MSLVATDAEAIAAGVLDATERTLDLVADLTDEQLIGPLLPIVNPLIWEIGHLAWFEEKFILRQACGEPPILPFGDALYDSGAVPHDTRWRLLLPSREETAAYMRDVARRVADKVLDPHATDVVRHFARYSTFHYDWHTEAITYTRQTLGHPAPVLGGGFGDGAATAGAGADPAGGDVAIAGGTVLIGGQRSDPFVYDNEKWAHLVDVPAFEIARRAVTNGEYLAFVEDGGYERREIWSSEAWAWRESVGANQPVYWRPSPDGGGWERRVFDQWRALERSKPVVHVSWYEADTFARWAGRRLPTEFEWEVAAGTGAGDGRRTYPWGEEPADAGHANVDWAGMDVVDAGAYAAGDSAHGCRQLIGNVWEWTGSTFQPYPNFERDSYADNSEQFFGSRQVLRGGSWATRGRLLRNTLRNYFTPERRDAFTGFRTAALQG